MIAQRIGRGHGPGMNMAEFSYDTEYVRQSRR